MDKTNSPLVRQEAEPVFVLSSRDSAATWSLPPQEITLGRDEVHLWLAGLDDHQILADELLALLSDDEQGRAHRFYLPQARYRYIIARAFLRMILQRYLQIPPDRLRFSYNCHGKPELALDSNPSTLRFNLSHSHSLAVYAVAFDRPVGVDLERIDPETPIEEMIETYFTSKEKTGLRRLSEPDRRKAFFECWTLKEAYLKAQGQGIGWNLKSGTPVFLGRARSKADGVFKSTFSGTPGWTLRAVDLGCEYVIALAAAGRGLKVRTWLFHLKGGPYESLSLSRNEYRTKEVSHGIKDRTH